MMSTPVQWWIIAAVLVALELTSGSFYLLMLAVGAAAGALAAHLGLDATWQWVAAAAVGAGLIAVLYTMRNKRTKPAPQANRDINLDIGSIVQVNAWNANGEARVRYRGSDWAARFDGREAALPGQFRIKAMDGNTLVLEPHATGSAMAEQAQSGTHAS
jgi:Membrane protein implicated in regulation of membrane protease activity